MTSSLLQMVLVRLGLIIVLLDSALTVSGSSSSGIGSLHHHEKKNAAFATLNHNYIQILPLLPHHHVVERERRQRQRELGKDDEAHRPVMPRRRNEAQQVGALYQGYGTHYVDLWCGSPPQRQTVIVDTGSGVTAFPCSGCTDCGVPDYHIDKLFMEDESSTFHANTCGNDGADGRATCMSSKSRCTGKQCKLSMAYAEGSRWDAYEGIDRCYVAGPHEIPLVVTNPSQTGEEVNVNKEGYSGVEDLNPIRAPQLAFDLVFGCQTLVTGLFKTQLADGIMGMSNRPETFWSQMWIANKMGARDAGNAPQAFSLCFSRPPAAEAKGTEAGALTLGGTDPRLHESPMVFTPAASGGRASFFSVKVRRILLREGRAGESAKSKLISPNDGVMALNLDADTLNKGGIIVDSGTTDTYWNMGISSEFKRVFAILTNGKQYSNKAMQLTEEELAALPTILFQLQSDENTNNADRGITDLYHTVGLAGSMDSQHPSDVILAFPPSHYMEYDENTKSYTPRFYPTERSGSVLGANAMMGHEILFDVDNDRIGFSESTCDYTTLVTGNGYDFDITGELHTEAETVDNGDIVPVQPPPVDCESFESGSKCQAAGCTWYWGKCTITAEGPGSGEGEGGDKDGEGKQTIPPASGGEEPVPGEQLSPNERVRCSTVACWGPVSAGLLIALCTGCFAFYSCCTSSSERAERATYSRAAATDEEVEMNGLKGHHNGDKNGDSFQDEPNDSPTTNGNGPKNGSVNRSMSSDSSYRDDPDDISATGSNGFKDQRSDGEPEFEGDFV